jgi:hypothetical protein
MSDQRTEPAEADEGKQAKQPKGKQVKPDKSKQAKAKKAAKDTKGKKSAGKQAPMAEATSSGPSVAGHPRAGSHVRQAKGWGGLVGFAIAAYLSVQAGVPTYEVGIRALAAGAAGYLLAWTCSVTVWRHLVLAELRVAADRRKAERSDQALDIKVTP